MPRTHEVSTAIYRRHIRLYRFLNDAWIFTDLVRPQLKERADELRGSKTKSKRSYRVPKKDRNVASRRTDADVGQVFQAQWERGIFETNVISIVSRVEAFIQECMLIALRNQPKKLSILGGKGGVPLELLLKHGSYDDLFEAFVESRCQDLMFEKPNDYLQKAQQVLSINLNQDVMLPFIEMKASRDVIVHNGGEINQIYVDKAGVAARGSIGDELPINADYFEEVIVNAKRLSGAVQRETEKVYK